MEPILNICKKYNIQVLNENHVWAAMGIGDLLIGICMLKNQVWKPPMYINLEFFTHKNDYYLDNEAALEFRLALINNLLLCNNLHVDSYKYSLYKNGETIFSQPTQKDYSNISNYKLNINLNYDTKFNSKYIIFHTKIRGIKNYTNYNSIKSSLKTFLKSYVCKYKIILLGEQNPPNTKESEYHNMTTCYDELLQLSENNDVLDLTTYSFDILNYDNYLQDVYIIKNAECNISFGVGGSLCTCWCFAKKTFFLNTLTINFNFECPNFVNNNIYSFNDITTLLNAISVEFGTTMNNILEKHKIEICTEYKRYVHCMGLGDILLYTLLIKQKLMEPNIFINLNLFKKFFKYPDTSLVFRIKLIHNLLKANNLPLNTFQFLFNNTSEPIQPKYESLYDISSEKLNISTTNSVVSMGKKYIIFHTKIRADPTKTNYNFIRNKVLEFSKIFKSNHIIIILGEKNPLDNYESKLLNSITVYNELRNLSLNNKLIDLTENNFDKLSYENYLDDVALIKGAECNILFGIGGSFCTSLCFSAKTFFIDTFHNSTSLVHENLRKNYIYGYHEIDIDTMFNEIRKTYSI